MEERISSGCSRKALIAYAGLIALLVTGTSWGAGPDNRHEIRNHDARIRHNAQFAAEPHAGQRAAEQSLRAQVPDLAVTYDEHLGTARTLLSHTGYLSAPNPQKAGDAAALALDFVRQQREILGLTAQDVENHQLRNEILSKVSGASRVYLVQTHAGIPVYNGQIQVTVNREGRILGLNNSFVRELAQAAGQPRPALSAAQAIAAAAADLGVTLSKPAAVVAVETGPRQVTRLSQPELSLEEMSAELVWLPVRDGDVRLAWNFQVQTLDYEHWYDLTVDATDGTVWTRFDWTNSGTYRVYEQPVESPNHTSPVPPADARTLAVNPEDATASPSGWFTGGTMSGNNVTACPDTSPANNVCDSNPQCAGTTCDFAINLGGAPSTYVPAATANLFYWNNVIHDIQYQYGFDEAGGNFQENNFGNGGAGGDSVNADAQDGSGNCNANFATPTDGGNPRMQMFTCNMATPTRDGDLDNAVIVHEYGHGISIRQVGGPGNSSCLNNSQQAGEGWSDWLALVYTAETGDVGTEARGMGTYLFGEPADGPGIRDLPYSTSQAVNNWTYESISGASIPHGVGSRWAQAAWEVYWALVDKWGFEQDLLNFDISDPNEAGNKRALFYINEGLKNTACSPTFTDNRDGIIQAATDNFGGVDVCDIWEAFAAFGLGTDAVSGGSNSTNPTNGFSVPAACQCSPQPIANAGPDQTICLGDSVTIGTPAQPSNTYSWTPGGQTTAQITVSPSVTTTYTVTATTSCGSAQDSVTITVDDGTGGAGLDDDFEGDNTDWTATGLWHEVNNTTCVSPSSTSGTAAFYYGQDASCTYDTGAANSGTLTSPSIGGITSTSTLSFNYWRVVESFAGDFDRTQVNILSSSGSTNVFSLNSSNASTAGWTPSGAISLAAFAGQTIQVQFVFDSVDSVSNAFTGWLIDDVVVTGESQCTPQGCTVDADCDNGLFCDGAETCNVATGACVAGTVVDCNDGVSCTADSCNEGTDSCDNAPNNAVCDNGLFCDGAETCDPVLDCQAGTPVDCNDGVGCTADSCNEGTDSCDNAPNDAACDDGLFCNGAETCDAVLDCQPGSDPCAGGACDETGDVCLECTIDADCDDGLFCTGVETCVGGACQASGDPCGAGETCNEGTDACDPAGNCDHSADFEAGAGGWTNGADTCTTGAFIVGTPDATTWQVGGGNPGQAFFTANNPGGIGTDDVDGGTCEALSPVVDCSGVAAAAVSLDYFHGQRDAADDAADGFTIEVLNNGAVVDTMVAIGDVTNNPAWTNVSTVVNNPGNIQVRVRATDAAGPGDIVEGGIDNVSITAAAPQTCSVDDDFEDGSVPEFDPDPASTCTTGTYVLANPTQQVSTVVTQPAGSNSGVLSIFTATNTAAGTDDVDGGNCILSTTTPYVVPAPSTLSIAYFHGQRDAGDDPAGDFFSIEWSNDGGATWNTVVSNGDTQSVAAWSTATAQVPAGNIDIRVQCSDGAGPGDIVECGIDDLSICAN